MKKKKKLKPFKIPKYPRLKNKDIILVNSFLYFVYDIYGKKNCIQYLNMMIEVVTFHTNEDERADQEYLRILRFLYNLKEVFQKKGNYPEELFP